MTQKRQLALIRKLCGLGLPAQTLVPSLLLALRQLIPSHSTAVFWVDDRFEMTGGLLIALAAFMNMCFLKLLSGNFACVIR